VEDSLKTGVAAVLDGGPCEHGVESTIIEVTAEGRVRLLRPGPLSLESILALPGIEEAGAEPLDDTAPVAPGMLKSHYRPSKGILLFTGSPTNAAPGDAVVFLARPENPAAHQFWLSERGDEGEIAHNLFHLLRQLDGMAEIARVYVEMPESNAGVLKAVRDRLNRAATPPD
tara:strand:+ start:1341 stop:1856 length:516 start_codon:yes stop_codon:yes gene_type:complete